MPALLTFPHEVPHFGAIEEFANPEVFHHLCEPTLGTVVVVAISTVFVFIVVTPNDLHHFRKDPLAARFVRRFGSSRRRQPEDRRASDGEVPPARDRALGDVGVAGGGEEPPVEVVLDLPDRRGRPLALGEVQAVVQDARERLRDASVQRLERRRRVRRDEAREERRQEREGRHEFGRDRQLFPIFDFDKSSFLTKKQTITKKSVQERHLSTLDAMRDREGERLPTHLDK